MLKIEITSEDIRERSGIAKKSGNAYHIRSQSAWCHVQGQKYPFEIEFNLSADQAAYKAGMYSVAPSSFYVDRFKGLSVASELNLVPFAGEVRKAA